MARLLLGVSGGIAAYKALEVVRLATKAGHAVRTIQTPTAQRFVGAASFAALTGAPVLTDEFERDPARGAFPDQAPPEHDPLSHLELVRNADGKLVLHYRPWLVMPPRTLELPAGHYESGRGLFYSEVRYGIGDDSRSVLLLPPRYLGHEAELAEIYQFAGVRDVGIRAGSSGDLDEAPARTATHCDGTHHCLRIAGRPHAPLGRR